MSALVTETYEAVAIQVQAQAPGQITPALQTLGEEIRQLRACLNDFELKRENTSEQQHFEFGGSAHRDSSMMIKAV